MKFAILCKYITIHVITCRYNFILALRGIEANCMQFSTLSQTEVLYIKALYNRLHFFYMEFFLDFLSSKMQKSRKLFRVVNFVSSKLKKTCKLFIVVYFVSSKFKKTCELFRVVYFVSSKLKKTCKLFIVVYFVSSKLKKTCKVLIKFFFISILHENGI